MTAAGGGCARDANGQATAEPAIAILMKSRRRTQPSPVRLRTTPVFEAYQIRAAMSALGQKRTCAAHKLMPLYPRKRHQMRHGGMSAMSHKRTSPRLSRSPHRRVAGVVRIRRDRAL